jgi:hypothetical protein
MGRGEPPALLGDMIGLCGGPMEMETEWRARGDMGISGPSNRLFACGFTLVEVMTTGFDLTRLCPFFTGAFLSFFAAATFFSVGPTSISNTAARKSGSFKSWDNCFLNPAAPSRSA